MLGAALAAERHIPRGANPPEVGVAQSARRESLQGDEQIVDGHLTIVSCRPPRCKRARAGRSKEVEGLTGIEPALSAWEAEVLPLNYSPVRLDAEVPAQPIKPGVDARARGGSLGELLHRIRVGDRVGRRADQAEGHAQERVEALCGRRGVGAEGQGLTARQRRGE